MKSLQLLKLLLRFGNSHKKYLWGILFTFFAAIFSGMSVTSFVPLLDAMISKQENFAWKFSTTEQNLILKVARQQNLITGTTDISSSQQQTDSQAEDEYRMRVTIESIYRKIDFTATNIQKGTLSFFEKLQLTIVIAGKMWVNQQEYTTMQFIGLVCLLILITMVLKIISVLIATRWLAFWGYRMIRDLRKHLMKKIIYNTPITAFYQKKSGMFTSRLTTDIENIASVMANEFRDTLTNIFYLIVYLLILVYLNFQLFLICALVLPLAFSPTNFFIKKIRHASTRGYYLLTELHDNVKETIGGIRTIRMQNMNYYEKSKFAEKNQTFYWKGFKRNLYEKAAPFIVEFTSVTMVVIVFLVASVYIDPENFSGGTFLGFVIILASSIRPVIQLSAMVGKIQNMLEGTKRIFIDHTQQDMLSKNSERRVIPLTLKNICHFKERLEFQNVYFSYTDERKTILSNVSFYIDRGETVTIIGPSGAGKSTIFDLLIGFLKPTSHNDHNLGRILIDGIDIKDYNIDQYRNLFGLVQQETFLFQGTIRENICIGAKGEYIPSERQIQHAAEMAFAHDFIIDLPDQYDTMVGNRGFQLSGGQRQRLAMARVILRNPEIILLDEATSALDRLSEDEIEKSLKSLGKQKTVISISHQINTTRLDGRLYVLDKGEIIKESQV